MNEILASKLEILAGDELLLGAIYEVFDERIEKSKPKPAETDDNMMLGEKYRAYNMAIEMLADAYQDLCDFKKETTKSNNFNKAK